MRPPLSVLLALFFLLGSTLAAADGGREARRLVRRIERQLEGEPVEVFAGDHVVEVRVRGADKGTVASRLAEDRGRVLALGDDTTDERMFHALEERPKTWTFHVGNGRSRASMRLKDPDAVRRFLWQLTEKEP